MEQTSSQAIVSKKHDPFLLAFLQYFALCGIYLYLQLYKRFFIFFTIMIVASVIPVPYLGLVVGWVAVVDTYIQAKGINDGTIHKETFSGMKRAIGLILIALSVIVALVYNAPLYALVYSSLKTSLGAL